MTVNDKNVSNIALNGDEPDLGSTGAGFSDDDDVVEREIPHDGDVSNVEIFEKNLDYTDYVEYSVSDMPADRKPSEKNPDGLHDARTALSRMTATDLEQFLNVYDFLTNPDPKIDQVIDRVGVEQLLSGELVDGERFKSDRVLTDVVDGDGPKSDPLDEYYVTFFDVYDHIERWKKRLRPMMNKIEDLAHATRVVQRQSSVPSVPGGVSRSRDPAAFVDVRPPSRRKIIGNVNDDDDDDEDINAISSRYLSNIDEYVNAAESSFKFRPKVPGDRPTAADAENRVASVNAPPPVQPVALCDVRPLAIADADRRTDPVTPKNTMTLLTPSSAYLETGYREGSADELEVKTYILT